MRSHAAAPDHTGGLPGQLQHDRVALLKNGGASSSAPAFLHHHQHGAAADFSHLQGLSVRTARRVQQEPQQLVGFNAAQPDARYRAASTPYGLLSSTSLNELMQSDAFICPDSAQWHGGEGELGGFAMGMGLPCIKQEPCSPAMPNTSTFIDIISGGSGFAQAFGQAQQQRVAGGHQHQQVQHHAPNMRPLQLPDPYAVQRFLQVAAELQQRYAFGLRQPPALVICRQAEACTQGTAGQRTPHLDLIGLTFACAWLLQGASVARGGDARN